MHAEKHLVKQELSEAVAFFIKRQRLVAQAMLDLGLDLKRVGVVGTLAWVPGYHEFAEELAKSQPDLSEEDRRKALQEYDDANTVPPEGIWTDPDGSTWEYYLHGIGCNLTNVFTREPVCWNCPDVNAFDWFFFMRHLEWQLRDPDRNAKLKHTQVWFSNDDGSSFYALIHEMMDEGMLDFTSTGRNRNKKDNSAAH